MSTFDEIFKRWVDKNELTQDDIIPILMEYVQTFDKGEFNQQGTMAFIQLMNAHGLLGLVIENAIEKILWDYKRSWSGAKFGKELYEWLSWAYDPEDEAMIFEQNIKVSMTKKGNKWMINEMNDDLFFIKDAGLTYFIDDFAKHPQKYI